MNEDIVTVAGLHYRRAAWRRRIVAGAIDILLLAAFCILLGGPLLALTVPLSIVYLFIGNGLLRGRSIGKRVTGLKIIDARHGVPITPVQDLIRHRYLLFANPLFLALTVFDQSQGSFDKPETFVVAATPVPPDEIQTPREKPAKLQLEAMRKSLERRNR